MSVYDLEGRLAIRIQPSDGRKPHLEAVFDTFADQVDYAAGQDLWHRSAGRDALQPSGKNGSLARRCSSADCRVPLRGPLVQRAVLCGIRWDADVHATTILNHESSSRRSSAQCFKLGTVNAADSHTIE
jgi:hypothetical protein